MSRKLMSGAKYLIVSVDSGKLLRIKDDSDKEDTRIVTGHPMDRDIKTREWKLEKLSNKMYKIRNVKTGKYLSVKTDSKEDGVEIVQKKRDDSPKQKFRIVLTKKGDFRIEMEDEKRRKRKEEEERERQLRKEKRDERRRDDKEEDSDSDSDCSSDSSDEERELRKERRRKDKKRRRRRMEKRLVLDVKGSSKRDGARIVQWRSNGEKNQRFRLIAVDTKSKL